MNRILNLHEVYDHQWFDNLIGYLKSKYEMVSMDAVNDFYNGGTELKNACHITVDDGEKSFAEVIYPVLKKHHVPASLFVSPKVLTEGTNYWFQEVNGYDPIKLKNVIIDVMSIPYAAVIKFDAVWILKTLKINEILEIIKRYQALTHTPQKASQNITIRNLKELDKSGLVTIGAHTMNHPILKNEDDASSEFEIRQSVCELSNILGYEVKYFAYPNGKRNLDFTAREEQTLKNNGIQLAVTTESGNLTLTDHEMRIPRLGLPDGQHLSIVKAKLVLGAYWNGIRKIKTTEELKQRRKFSY